VALHLTLAGWALLELGLRVRERLQGRGGAARDRTTVEVDPGQAVVSAGPYRWVRHPSYSRLLLIVAGFGLATGNWLALVICIVLPLPPLLRRIQVEEAELTGVLGDRYRAYQAQTKRLIPGLW
jgi:protein-S-isoprenylcysteine O-methyltransferase Ste14